MSSTNARLVLAERDSLLCLGLLSYAYTRFDVPVVYPNEPTPSHVLGLNICAAVVDNADGELLALDRNTIHQDGSPLQHGEQRALRTAITRVAAKRPRQPAESVEGYYRSSMFMGKGSAPEDFLDIGGTLFTTLEPCPMCASSALVCRMKRVVFLVPDERYGGAWITLKARYYEDDASQYERLSVGGAGSNFADCVDALYDRVISKAADLRTQGVRDTHFLDFCRKELSKAFEILNAAKPSDLASVASGDLRNVTTLAGLQRALNMSYAR